ncbi:hypothetical protein [Cuneatibacter caecimuris]|uniref:Uncharacterized protein n=1 Tax=Cuneatibacter caecimuris TaxID=1796618 RepID=A0A4Q7PKC7_9FIRM|nr:hypothetical protein [Cuneatibacter caecimuris]RZT01173.1 hypothetical protein EV209_1615 [Cuneatibacter caecimuris]
MFDPFRNDDIKIDFPVPQRLKALMEEVEGLYQGEDEVRYEAWIGQLGTMSKSYYLANVLTEEQLNKILDRYGAW